MSASYDAASIEVLSGLEPVKKRPGMYTQTERPNHLAQEVVDNSVDEAIAGFATKVDVVLHKDGSLSVTDDGRGMPVDKHPGFPFFDNRDLHSVHSYTRPADPAPAMPQPPGLLR